MMKPFFEGLTLSADMDRREVEKRGFVSNNSIFEGTRGRVGGTVFREVNGDTIASRRPKSPKTESVKQKEGRDRFRLATAFAHKELLDPVRRDFFQVMFKTNPRKLRNSYTAALTYYLNEVHPKDQHVEVSKKMDNAKSSISPHKATVAGKLIKRKAPIVSLKFRQPSKLVESRKPIFPSAYSYTDVKHQIDLTVDSSESG